MFDKNIMLDLDKDYYNRMCEACKEFPGMSVAFAPYTTTYFNEIELVKTNKFTFENTLGEFFYAATRRRL